MHLRESLLAVFTQGSKSGAKQKLFVRALGNKFKNVFPRRNNINPLAGRTVWKRKSC